LNTGAGYDANWTLNATGISNITKTGVTKFGLLYASDLQSDVVMAL